MNLEIDPLTSNLLFLSFMAFVGVIVAVLVHLQDRRERKTLQK